MKIRLVSAAFGYDEDIPTEEELFVGMYRAILHMHGRLGKIPKDARYLCDTDAKKRVWDEAQPLALHAIPDDVDISAFQQVPMEVIQ